MLAQQAYSRNFSLMWRWGERKSFDVVVDSTQIMPSRRALNFAWGEHHWLASSSSDLSVLLVCVHVPQFVDCGTVCARCIEKFNKINIFRAVC